MFGLLLKLCLFTFWGLSDGRQLPMDVVGLINNSFFSADFFESLLSKLSNVERTFD